MPDRMTERHRMVATQIEGRGVRDPRVLDAMREVPREAFVDPPHAPQAYADRPLPIGEGQTISQPYIVALMLEAAEIGPDDRLLEVGAGSGYAAAVASRIAAEVRAVERIGPLAEAARERLTRLGYDNVEIRHDDGSNGWPEGGQFDAILVAAAGPGIPDALRGQLAPGGRLVMPVGQRGGAQRLVRLRRTDAGFERDDLGGVAFVPLIGAGGFADPAAPRHAPTGPAAAIARIAEPFAQIDDDFAALFDRFADRRVILLGEASHGTAEFYRARAAITRRLVSRHGFGIIACEADWPDMAVLDRRIRQRPGPVPAEPPFQRFPRWMWRNTEFAALVEWLRHENAGREPEDRAALYGLDLYSLGASIDAVLGYLDRHDPEAARIARVRYGCLSPWADEPAHYGSAVLRRRYDSCEEAAALQCREILQRGIDGDPDGYLDAAQNARLVSAAERYYRVMYQGGAASWNLRDRHMFETLEQILAARGPDARAVVWAHNSHIGDARATAMGRDRGELNLGQLCRERFGDKAALIGFGTGAGTVAAADDWGAEMEVMDIRPPLPGSWEALCRETGIPRFVAELARAERLPGDLIERFIGVIYRPESERASHYMKADLPRQFDAWVWFDRSSALEPTSHGGDADPAARADPEDAETYPTGL